jgi:cell division septation protein DedD
MAEVQTSTQSGEMSQRFIEFVMMQAQQASLFLGRIPSPQSGKTEILLEPAKLFIDHLEMIREKTRGNLTNEEKEILNSVLSDLEMAYVQAAHAASSSPPPTPPAASSAEPAASTASPDVPSEEASESKKKFSKSYGA